jgi:hypothetical protein
MSALIWTGTALAVLAGIALVTMGLRARRTIDAATTPEATRATLQRLAAINGAAFAAGLLGIALMVTGLILR